VPWHRHALPVFAVIFTDGATYQMLEGNGYGLGADGLYDPELMSYFAVRRCANADQLSTIVKATAVGGHYSLQTSGGASYAKARNLLPHARAAYDRALDQYDVLVMPTVPSTASPLPSGGEDNITLLNQALGMVGNTAPLDATGHPAISVPAGLVDDLPVGMMIMGKRFDDATVLKCANAFESLRGGFPAAPGPA
jgi:amidase